MYLLWTQIYRKRKRKNIIRSEYAFLRILGSTFVKGGFTIAQKSPISYYPNEVGGFYVSL